MIRACLIVLVWTVEMLILGPFVLAAACLYPWQPLANLATAIWAKAIVILSGMHLTVTGLDRLEPGKHYFIISNHQSALDIPLILAILNGACRFMAKDSLLRVPLFGFIMARNGIVPVDRTNARATLRSLNAMIESLRRNPINFVVFPEGTRSVTGELLPFRRGAMKVCLRSGLPIVPMAIDGTCTVHKRGTLRLSPGEVRVTIGAPIPAETLAGMTPEQLHDSVRGEIASALGAPDGRPEEQPTPTGGVVEDI